jgi:hypothetical protein
VDLATFRRTSTPRKIVNFADFRPLTADEIARWVAGERFGDVVTASYLRMCATGGESAPDGVYVKA